MLSSSRLIVVNSSLLKSEREAFDLVIFNFHHKFFFRAENFTYVREKELIRMGQQLLLRKYLFD